MQTQSNGNKMSRLTMTEIFALSESMGQPVVGLIWSDVPGGRVARPIVAEIPQAETAETVSVRYGGNASP
jgi:hypothetical protein